VAVEKLRPWSAIVRVPTAEGDVWFKENPPADEFEPALTELLARRRPDCLPELVAWEGPRMLTRHIGPRLRELHDAGEADPRWEDLLPLYAELQIDFMGAVGAALEVGTPDERPELLAARYEELYGQDGLLPAVRDAAERVVGTIPLSVVHMEAHDGNVFVRDGRPYFLDWAEALVSHPFVGPLLALRSATERAGLEPGSAAVERLRDLYLEPFTRFAPFEELRELFWAGYLLAPVSRAYLWHRTLVGLPSTVTEEHGDPVQGWRDVLGELVDGTTTLGGA
jgi:hypothetical protein